MKIAIVQIQSVKGDVAHNLVHHQKMVDAAVAHGATAVNFPELSLTGYEPTLAKTLATSLDDPRFEVFQTVSDVQQVTIGVGMPTHSPDGVCISMILFRPQRPREIYSKKYLHVDEEPFFVSGRNFPIL
ncbi:MAG: carbon-nitrogen hydrolase family protein, partial [Anaerolineales bacterium]|nr:carbon-nitrogen hydrolase family protein [Anaerolineales bacterium]